MHKPTDTTNRRHPPHLHHEQIDRQGNQAVYFEDIILKPELITRKILSQRARDVRVTP